MSWYLGLDLGQAADFSALVAVEVIRKDEAAPQYLIRHLHRFPLHTAYTTVVQEVAKLVATLKGATLVIDQTGVGRAIFDMFKGAGLEPIGITITSGDTVSHEGGSWRVPKRDLVGVLAVALQNGEMKIAKSLPDSDTLTNELLNFKVKISVSGHDSYEAWRENIHDDLVLAAACAVWYAKRREKTGRFLIMGAKRRW